MTNKKEWSKQNTISIRTAASNLKIKTDVLRYQVECGNLKSINERIRKSDIKNIEKQQSTYIGLKEFILRHDSDRFVTKIARNRNKYIDYLEENEYFGVQLYEADKMVFTNPESVDFYLTREDSTYIDFKSTKFFEDFGFTEEEKIHRILNSSSGHPFTLKYIKEYIKTIDDSSNIYMPSLTYFVETMFSVEDVIKLNDEDIISIVHDSDIQKTKEFIVGFVKMVSCYEKVKYHNIDFKNKESESIPAYSYDEYIKLAKILFNKEYDEAHDLTIKALENHNYAEMWLFLSIHYICGWRASDMCKNWVYPNLKNSKNPFKINIDTLKEDILCGNISDIKYEKVALYAIRKIEMSFNRPSKTPRASAGKLRSEIVPELRSYFGKLIMIAEHHHINIEDGYMKSGRTSIYCNWTYCREFFGEDIYEFTGRHNISSTRLNKSYLQGIEQTTRDKGNTTLVAHIVASFARNHSSIDTTAIYLKDHGLTGESAEIVLFMMMQRGVFGEYLYAALITAYPEAFSRLSVKEQTKLMEKIPLTAYELETCGTSLIATEKMEDALSQGEIEEPKEILKAMYAIGQGQGKGKDEGIYCKKKALGESCVHPAYESCLANLCPYHVFTSEGLPSLIKVIKKCKEKAITSKNRKNEIVYYKIILPAFQDIINAVLKEMSRQEKESMKLMISEVLNE